MPEVNIPWILTCPMAVRISELHQSYMSEGKTVEAAVALYCFSN